MLKIISLGACGAFLMACSGNPAPRSVADASGCGELGDTNQAAARLLSPNAVYGATRLEANRGNSVTGAQPGTSVLVHATPGTSKEYVERVLSCHAVYGKEIGPNDPFHPAEGHIARVEVLSSGSGYEIQVAGENSRTDDAIWHRAQSLAYSTVQAEQVASADTRVGRH